MLSDVGVGGGDGPSGPVEFPHADSTPLERAHLRRGSLGMKGRMEGSVPLSVPMHTYQSSWLRSRGHDGSVDRLVYGGIVPASLPYPWGWDPRKRKDGWWTLPWGSRERSLHLCVFGAVHGEREWECHWCAKGIGWWRWASGEGRRVHVDHVDGDKDHCHPSNLVASCVGCNRRKGRDWWGVGYTEYANVPAFVVEVAKDALADVLRGMDERHGV
jgi:hypothetical protein